MKTVPLSTVFLLLRDIAYKMQRIDIDELDADYEQHLQRERDKPPELTASKSTRLSQAEAERTRDPISRNYALNSVIHKQALAMLILCLFFKKM